MGCSKKHTFSGVLFPHIHFWTQVVWWEELSLHFLCKLPIDYVLSSLLCLPGGIQFISHLSLINHSALAYLNCHLSSLGSLLFFAESFKVGFTTYTTRFLSPSLSRGAPLRISGVGTCFPISFAVAPTCQWSGCAVHYFQLWKHLNPRSFFLSLL